VYAFEPTHYAAAKFQCNLFLNPDLSARIELIQAFVSDQSSTSPPMRFPPSPLTTFAEVNTYSGLHLYASKTTRRSA
jgi:hypothetical protein